MPATSPPSSPLPPDDPEIARLYRDGSTGMQIAARLRLPLSHVYRTLRRLGVERRPPGRRDVLLASGEVAHLYHAGQPVTAIAAQVQRTPACIYQIIRRLGVEKRPRTFTRSSTWVGKIPPEQRTQLCAELRARHFPSLSAAGRHYGVSRELVRQIAAAEGIATYLRATHRAAREERKRAREQARRAQATATEARREYVALLWQDGVSLAEIARAADFPKARAASHFIAKMRRRHPADFPRRQPARNSSAAELARRAQRRARFAELWQRGTPLAQIASALGYTFDSAKKALVLHRRRQPADFPRRKDARPAAAEQRRDWLCGLWKDGADARQIAPLLGLTLGSTRNLLADYRRRYPAHFPPRPQPEG